MFNIVNIFCCENVHLNIQFKHYKAKHTTRKEETAIADKMRKRVMKALEVNPNMTIEGCKSILDQKRSKSI